MTEQTTIAVTTENAAITVVRSTIHPDVHGIIAALGPGVWSSP